MTTNMTDEWVRRAVAANPCKLLDSGNVRTCPVRLSFPKIFERGKPQPPNLVGKYKANLLFPAGADISFLKKAASEATLAKWANAGTKGGPKLKSPFKDGGTVDPDTGMSMADQYEGYAAGSAYIIATGDRQPAVIDSRLAAITDPARVYPGVWAIVTLRPFTYDKGVNKGTSFGLQSLMIIADDTEWGGGGGNPSSDYAGVSVDASTTAEGVFGDDAEKANALFD